MNYLNWLKRITTVGCPYCGAKPGEACRTRKGRVRASGLEFSNRHLHDHRKRAYRRWLAETSTWKVA